ncbi:hypothetical protein M408DRAFT_334273 [Serendipita vermifera MAFF 305830]|uniref:Rab-GAP TBC domain-containing protein n=1 Tax=Serendipita vermifera MAFF 305830 TaxID=933852 RepID=A0A0C3AKF3_SERVB|nr:hypothetical protein M408DRAFT_334273 [Serendipita vermifera MAFF 305830]
MSTLKPSSPRPSPRNSPRPSPRASPRPNGGRSPLSKPFGSLLGTPRSAGLIPTTTRPSSPRTTAAAFNKLLDDNYPVYRSAEDVKDGLKRLRRLILADGIPAQVDPVIRARVWKVLLQIGNIHAESYLDLVRRGPCQVREKIRNDTFRTLATDRGFKERVREDMLIRLLDAFVWKNQDNAEEGRLAFGYVQGMNVLAAPFLYTMPSEVEAFYAFSKFIEQCCPLYVQPTLDGVHRGLRLLDRCLEILDLELYSHLRSKKLSAELYAFPSVLTLCACTPPLEEVLRLWDFLLAYGLHLNILCVIGQLLLIRGDLMSSQSPMKLLRTFPPLDSQQIIAITVTLVRDIPSDLYDELTRHPWEMPAA